MLNDYLNLWITRVANISSTDGQNGDEELSLAIKDRKENLLVIDNDIAKNRKKILYTLRELALNDSKVPNNVTGWLVVSVPVPNSINSAALLHRMIRKLYFSTVLHGLGEIPSLREAVQSLRLSFFQTRGTFTKNESSSKKRNEGADLGFSLSLTSPSISSKLTAAEEVTVLEGISAQMQQMNLMESEDQLLYDLQILTQLRLQVDQYAAQVTNAKIPRWELVRGFFKNVYANFQEKKEFNLRPVFVFEAYSLSSVISLLEFFSEAASLPGLQDAEIIVLGGEILHSVFLADEKLHHPIFRSHVVLYPKGLQLSLSTTVKKEIKKKISCVDNPYNLSPEVALVLENI
ncbi:MAG: hypothetical protein HQK84_11130 [Nitrospinae bacterium]|nr:hypothetical protein [Nitrospinota bacterium]